MTANFEELTVSEAAKRIGRTREWVYARMALWSRSGGQYGLRWLLDDESGRRYLLARDIEEYQSRRAMHARDAKL